MQHDLVAVEDVLALLNIVQTRAVHLIHTVGRPTLFPVTMLLALQFEVDYMARKVGFEDVDEHCSCINQ